MERSKSRRDGRLVVFSPMPPLQNGIADYTSELLPLLAAARDTTVVVDDHAPEPPAHPAYRVVRLSEYEAREARYRDADHLYQVGNNADHAYLLPWLMRRPGVVVLHDVSLHHLVDQATLRWDDVEAYCAALELEYGAPGRVLADQFRQRRWRTRSVFYELPLTRELLARARAVIVHSFYAANKVAAQQADVPVELVRHHVCAAAREARRTGDRAQARAALGVDEDVVLLVSLGFVTRAKQTETVLRFLQRNRAWLPRVRYVIAGHANPADFDVHSRISELGLDDIVHVTGYIDEAAFYRHILASDIVVNLRYPSGGETSGTLIRALGMGACVVVNDIGPFAEYPEEVCAKVAIDAGGRCDADFERVVLALAASPLQRRRYANAAERYMRETHGIRESVRRYLDALREHGGREVLPLPGRSEAATLPPARREALLASVAAERRGKLPLWAAQGAVLVQPSGADDRALVIGRPDAVPLLQDLFGYADHCIDTWASIGCIDAVPAADRRRHRIAVVHCSDEEATQALAQALPTLNRRLAHDALMLLTIEGIPTLSADSAAHARNALEAAGFVVERSLRGRENLSFSLDAHPRPPAGDSRREVLLCARKCSEFISLAAFVERSDAPARLLA